MKILFDQGVPVPLRRALRGHTVATAYELGWSTLLDGALLTMAEQAEYELLITTDRQMKDQQRLRDRQLAILALSTTSWPRIEPHAEAIREVIEQMVTSEYREYIVL